jgi:hypothetical protein
MKKLIVVFTMLTVANFATAQLKSNINQLEFMAGKWVGSMEWGDMEEYWGTPMGNNMICSFRCVKDGKVVFYEFIVIEQQGDVPVMKLRHFSPGSIGWEEKDKPWEYPLVKLDGKLAVFESADKKTRLLYERLTNTTLKAVLEREEKGKWQVDAFEYTLSTK